MLINLLIFTVKALIVGCIATIGYMVAAAYSIELLKDYMKSITEGFLPIEKESE